MQSQTNDKDVHISATCELIDEADREIQSRSPALSIRLGHRSLNANVK